MKWILIAEQSIWFFPTETWWRKVAINWLLAWVVLISKLGFSQSSCKDFFLPRLSQQDCFCTRSINIYMFSIFSFSKNLLGVKYFCECMMLPHLTTIFFSKAIGFNFSSRGESTSFKLWIVLIWTNLNFIGVSGNLIGGDLLMHLILFELLYHLHPKIPSGLLPSWTQWKLLSIKGY